MGFLRRVIIQAMKIKKLKKIKFLIKKINFFKRNNSAILVFIPTKHYDGIYNFYIH